jgi:hypothetical protein
MSHLNHSQNEANIAWTLIAQLVDQLETKVEAEDLDAAIIATLATALELASHRKLKPIYEIYADTKHV